MAPRHWLAPLVLLAGAAGVAAAGLRPSTWARLNDLNGRIHGQVLDFTDNHGADRRIYSPALDQRRSVYAYLPPGFDPSRQYPLMIYLHGYAQNERSFLQLVEPFDGAMADGHLPPFIVVAPDGSIRGGPTLLAGGSFYLNTNAGRFEDYIVQDVWDFAVRTFPVRPDREFHILGGASMGGFGAYNLGFKHPDKFKILVGTFPALNLRYVDCHGRYFANFDPNCLGNRDRLKPLQPVARFYGLIVVRERKLARPLFGINRTAIQKIAAENPAEMLEAYDIRPGTYDMFVGYGGRDEFNIDAQVESFLYLARRRGLEVTVAYDPRGHHSLATGLRLFPDFARWLGPLLRG